jgi:tetraacyldisaccharide 4'-kinase
LNHKNQSLRLLLFPFAILYNIVTSVRNRLYDQGLKPSASFEIPVIGVGNIAVGGTGKTPMIEYLVRLLKPNYKIATLSRGYGRATKGFRVVKSHDNAITVGDEPFQFYKKFHPAVNVAVGEERALAIPMILDEHADTKVILLDDSFQHRKVKPSFQILLTDYSNLFYNDLLLPAGRLRESKYNVNRADVIVVTKCPLDLGEDERLEIEASIRDLTSKPVFFATIRYGNLISIGPAALHLPDSVILMTAIANAKPIEDFVSHNFKLLRSITFADHYFYKERDLAMITTLARQNKAAIITTEKDAAKIDTPAFKVFLSQTPFFYLPMEIEFLKNGKDFDEMVLNAVENA